jgi:hypothetical protein
MSKSIDVWLTAAKTEKKERIVKAFLFLGGSQKVALAPLVLVNWRRKKKERKQFFCKPILKSLLAVKLLNLDKCRP